MKKTANLGSAMNKAAGNGSTAVLEPPAAEPRSPNREGKRQIAGWFSAEVWKQIRNLCTDEMTSVQALLTEALNDLFRKRGKAPIA